MPGPEQESPELRAMAQALRESLGDNYARLSDRAVLEEAVKDERVDDASKQYLHDNYEDTFASAFAKGAGRGFGLDLVAGAIDLALPEKYEPNLGKYLESQPLQTGASNTGNFLGSLGGGVAGTLLPSGLVMNSGKALKYGGLAAIHGYNAASQAFGQQSDEIAHGDRKTIDPVTLGQQAAVGSVSGALIPKTLAWQHKSLANKGIPSWRRGANYMGKAGFSGAVEGGLDAAAEADYYNPNVHLTESGVEKQGNPWDNVLQGMATNMVLNAGLDAPEAFDLNAPPAVKRWVSDLRKKLPFRGSTAEAEPEVDPNAGSTPDPNATPPDPNAPPVGHDPDVDGPLNVGGREETPTPAARPIAPGYNPRAYDHPEGLGLQEGVSQLQDPNARAAMDATLLHQGLATGEDLWTNVNRHITKTRPTEVMRNRATGKQFPVWTYNGTRYGRAEGRENPFRIPPTKALREQGWDIGRTVMNEPGDTAETRPTTVIVPMEHSWIPTAQQLPITLGGRSVRPYGYRVEDGKISIAHAPAELTRGRDYPTELSDFPEEGTDSTLEALRKSLLEDWAKGEALEEYSSNYMDWPEISSGQAILNEWDSKVKPGLASTFGPARARLEGGGSTQGGPGGGPTIPPVRPAGPTPFRPGPETAPPGMGPTPEEPSDLWDGSPGGPTRPKPRPPVVMSPTQMPPTPAAGAAFHETLTEPGKPEARPVAEQGTPATASLSITEGAPRPAFDPGEIDAVKDTLAQLQGADYSVDRVNAYRQIGKALGPRGLAQALKDGHITKEQVRDIQTAMGAQ